MADTTFSFQDAIDSKDIFEYLTKNLSWDVPDPDFSKFNVPDDLLNAVRNKPTTLTDESLTSAKFDDQVREYDKINGTGTLDKILEAVKANLWVEYHKGRITGAEYSQAFVTLVQGSLQTAVQFLISKDKAYWDSITAQINALSAMVELETKKMQLLHTKYQANLVRAQFANSVMDLCIKDKQYGTMVLTDQLNTNKDNREERLASKQIEVMTQQIASYKRKDERDTVKLQTDAWAVSKGIAEDTEVPTPLANPAINISMDKALGNVGLK